MRCRATHFFAEKEACRAMRFVSYRRRGAHPMEERGRAMKRAVID